MRAHEANSHANHGWEKFTQKVIDIVAKKRTNGVVFLAWGTPAAKRVAKVDKVKHCVLQSVHPSPLSAARGFVSTCLDLSHGAGLLTGFLSLIADISKRLTRGWRKGMGRMVPLIGT